MFENWRAISTVCGLCLVAGAAYAREAPPFPPTEVEGPAVVRDNGAFLRHPMTYGDGMGNYAHAKPTPERAKQLGGVFAATQAPVIYGGGPIMPTVQIYNVFWAPPTLQDGTPATMTPHYIAATNGLAADYAGHSIDANNTQYYQNINKVVKYVSGLSTSPGAFESFGGYYVDTNPFPTSGCTDSVTPGDCVSDAQLQAELKRVMAVKGWTGGLNKLYMVYTAGGEGSCMPGTGCAYTDYCGYHGNIGSASSAIIYVNMPYGVAGCGPTTSPDPDPAASAAVDTGTHEISESITDPVGGTGWTDPSGNEIGDKCIINNVVQYGKLTFDHGKANQFWNGHYYTVQEEWDNHTLNCVQQGP